ncbi:MAG: acyl-CoA dehydrogenase [Bradymonadaceae bacterium]|nr:acyl-CoA dehydrogenase [Lujinxingiaceae bacterium]
MEFFDSTYGFLTIAPTWSLIAGIIVAVLAFGFWRAPLWLWTIALAVVLYGLAAPIGIWVAFLVVAIVFNLRPLRQVMLSAPLMGAIRRMGLLPAISETQRVAIEAGSVWVEGEFFSGRPNFKRLRSEPYPQLSEAEQAFLDGPVEELCAMANDWELQRKQDLSPEIWDFIKHQGFWAMIIPKEYGGRAFSPAASSAVIAKLASRSVPVAVTVMVPNSIGPAELLMHYGTDAQKEYYLPRLARGEEIPCFALTEPQAGSDAGAISSSGEVFAGDDGELYIRLNWKKRYITLAAVSTVLGLAFQLRDPQGLLGLGEDLGITCALIPTDTHGVVLGRRHDPLGIPFINSPTEGHNVVVPISQIIGGPAQAGRGWRMLTESLAEGRGVSLPAQSAGGAKLVTRVVSAYAAVRQQFGMPIGRFEGIEEALARIAGLTYIVEAMRRYTAGGIVSSGKPAVVSAIAKYNATEILRKVTNDGMDVIAGAGISRGPRNLLAQTYMANPIGITVEGANILTRTLIIFGQGVIRAHPYALHEIEALERRDTKGFDRAFWAHIGFVFCNLIRVTLLSLTRGLLAGSPVSGPTARYYRKLAWSSASFALLTDIAMGTLGGSLQRREQLTGRFADILSWMYMATATLRRFEAGGSQKDELVAVHWAMQHAFAQIQAGFDGIYRNMPGALIGGFFRGPIAQWSRLNPISHGPSDLLASQLAHAMQYRGKLRHELTAGIYIPTDTDTEQLARLERALRLVRESQPIYDAIALAVRKRRLPKAAPAELFDLALKEGIISPDAYDLVLRTEEARNEAITVDAFTTEDFPTEVVTPTIARSAAE